MKMGTNEAKGKGQGQGHGVAKGHNYFPRLGTHVSKGENAHGVEDEWR